MDAGGEHPGEPRRVLGKPAARLREHRFEHRPPGLQTAGLRGGGHVSDLVADAVQVGFLAHAAHGDPPQPGGGAERSRLLAVQHRVREIHGREVGEPRYGHLRELLRGPCDVQRGADPDPGLVQQLQTPAREYGEPAHTGVAEEEQAVVGHGLGGGGLRGREEKRGEGR